MKYCVRVQEPTAWHNSSPDAQKFGLEPGRGVLSDGNLRGERRWERNAAAALLVAGRDVGTPQHVMQKPPNTTWQDVVNPSDCDLYLAHGGPNDKCGINTFAAEAPRMVLNYFGFPGEPLCSEIIQCASHRGRRASGPPVVFTVNFRALTSVIEALRRLMSEDMVDWLPTPAVSHVRFDHDPRAQQTLLWAGRGIDLSMDAVCEHLWPWVVDRLQNSNLQFEILTGMGPTDLDFRKFQGSITDWFWGLAGTEALRPVRERVIVHGWMDWHDVFKVYARTRAVVGPPQRFGGPPLEAAAYGIPTIGLPNGLSVFHDSFGNVFEEYLSSSRWNGVGPDHLAILDRLLDDEAFFRRSGDAYRNYVHENYTYAAFVKRLDEITTRWT